MASGCGYNAEYFWQNSDYLETFHYSEKKVQLSPDGLFQTRRPLICYYFKRITQAANALSRKIQVIPQGRGGETATAEKTTKIKMIKTTLVPP